MLSVLGSLRFTVIVIAGLALVVLYVYRAEAASGWLLAVPFGLFAVNLGAAVVTQPKFRTQGWLLAFHLALLLLVVLVAVGRLTYLSARTEVTTGQPFEGVLLGVEAGPLHPNHYGRLRFLNEDFVIEYLPGPSRDRTFNTVRWQDDAGVGRRAVIGDDVPLVLEGYRFYTTHNKGFAAVLGWTPAGRPAQVGALHFPSWPGNAFTQRQLWSPPNVGEALWLQLQFDDPILSEQEYSVFRVPSDPALVVRRGDSRWQLLPGDTIELPDGTLKFGGVTTWMGYKVFYDPTIPWLLAVSVIAVACISGHFIAKYRRRDWRTAGATPTAAN